jgi:hypothetical protein
MEQGGLLFSEEQSLKMKAKLSTFAMQKDTRFHAVPSSGELSPCTACDLRRSRDCGLNLATPVQVQILSNSVGLQTGSTFWALGGMACID